MGKWAEAAAGIGLGVVVGILMGLSTASLVGSVVAALAAGLAAFLGLVPNVSSDRTVRIAGFGFACAASVLFGLAIRTDMFGWNPTIQAEVKEWEKAGYSADDARSLVAYKILGVRPPNRQVSDPPKLGSREKVLFSADDVDLCSQIVRLPPSQVMKVIKESANGRAVVAMEAAISAAPESARDQITRAFTQSLCGS